MTGFPQRSKGVGGHQKTKGSSDEWITPQWVIDALGDFDLDPCSAVGQPWPTADRSFTIEENGLMQTWTGRVWMNPPYDRFQISSWFDRLVGHGCGTALVFARTETDWFQRFVFQESSALLFVRKRIRFCSVDGTPGRYTGGAPSVLIAYGHDDAELLRDCGIDGAFIDLRGRPTGDKTA